MTSAKTVLFLLMSTDICHGGHYHKDASLLSYFGVIIIPNGIWICMPFFCAVSLGSGLIQMIKGKSSSKLD